ncbi:MAG: hypothetical protein LUC98_04165 [Lachnospiraceae bacterium]|nr:hypothetical protein [Lachnospiraceae bacterium]
MSQNYTRVVNEKYFRSAENDLAVMWYDIENMPEDAGREEWKKELTKLALEYSFSSRFALMRILCCHATGRSLNSGKFPVSFKIRGRDREYCFQNISMEHASELGESELADYEAALLELANGQTAEEQTRARFLIAKALRDVNAAREAVSDSALSVGMTKTQISKETKTLLSRDEALKLGHLLGFSLEEMEWFLLRVFDYEDGFRYTASEDLIEVYGFLTNTDWQAVAQMKEAYRRMAEKIPKKDRDSYAELTRDVETLLPGLVASWSLQPERMESCFFKWMEEQAPWLDAPSRTATAVYRRLAVYLYKILMKEEIVPEPEEFAEQILYGICTDTDSIYEKWMKATLFEKGAVSGRKCKSVSDELLISNKESFTSAHDPAKAWRTMSIGDNCLPKVIMAGRPDAARSRVCDLLLGDAQVEKGDMLHLIWYAFNLVWLESPLDTPCNSRNLYSNLAVFTESCRMVLERALLPPFYPPHLTEQSMMLSIIASTAEEGTGVPADVYAEICEALIRPRNRSKKAMGEEADGQA